MSQNKRCVIDLNIGVHGFTLSPSVVDVVNWNSFMNGNVVVTPLSFVVLSSMSVSDINDAAWLVAMVAVSVGLVVEGCAVVAGSVEVTGLVPPEPSVQHTPRESLTNENSHMRQVHDDATHLLSRTGIVEEYFTRLVQFRLEAAPQECTHSTLLR